jgi:hypothetical protein
MTPLAPSLQFARMGEICAAARRLLLSTSSQPTR